VSSEYAVSIGSGLRGRGRGERKILLNVVARLVAQCISSPNHEMLVADHAARGWYLMSA
jgi:hypothetical protein